MKKKTILICGATGFIGRNLAEFYAKNSNYDVVGVFNRRPPFSHDRIRWVQADLTNPLETASVISGVNILIQAAATTSGVKDIFSQPHTHVTDNAVMNSYLFRLAYEHELEHVIFFSCTIMLASNPLAQTEEDFDANARMHPRYFGAGWTKVYLEKMCEFYSQLGITKFTAIRHSNVYGPHDKFDLETSHVCGATITKVLRASSSITIWGRGDETRDLLYIQDLVDMVNLVINKQEIKFEIYNCGSGSSVSINDLVNIILNESCKSLSLEYDFNMPTILNNLILDCSKAKKNLNWAPQHSLPEGINKTIKWWRDNIKD
jgi:GDP-L-fucose synthase